jgi:hypothetical protein
LLLPLVNRQKVGSLGLRERWGFFVLWAHFKAAARDLGPKGTSKIFVKRVDSMLCRWLFFGDVRYNSFQPPPVREKNRLRVIAER